MFIGITVTVRLLRYYIISLAKDSYDCTVCTKH